MLVAAVVGLIRLMVVALVSSLVAVVVGLIRLMVVALVSS